MRFVNDDTQDQSEDKGIMKIKNFTSPKHGSVIHITKDEAKRLETYWSSQSH